MDVASTRPPILVLYGTQTGTAKEVAEEIGREGSLRWFQVKVSDVADFNVVDLPTRDVVIFVCSTTGQGQVPDGMKKFWRFLLQKNLDARSLSNVKFAVFGLGDSSYPKFNWVAKMLHNRLLQLSGSPLTRRGDGNDQHPYGLYGDLFPWMEELWRRLLTEYPLPPGIQIKPGDVLPRATYEVVLAPPSAEVLHEQETSAGDQAAFKVEENMPLFDEHNPFKARLLSNARITDPNWEQDVRHVVLDISGSGIIYTPGDVVYIRPRNPPKLVDKFLEMMSLNPNQIITQIKPNDKENHQHRFDVPITIRELFMSYLDIAGTPIGRRFFWLLSFFCDDKQQKERLAYFATKMGYTELYDYALRAKRSCFDIFVDFCSAKPSLEYLLDIIPPLKPRPFSISSAQEMVPNEIHVSMVVVKYTSPIGRLKHGICSTWLANLKPENRVHIPIWVKPGTVKFPSDVTTPVIMVGPGTGCAIFRAFLQQRYQHHMTTSPEHSADVVFLFGCRKQDCDFLYKDEWKKYLDSRVITKLATAFSRDQPKKRYVGHLLTEMGAQVWDLIQNKGALFYISGRAGNMPRDVRQALIDVIATNGKMTEQEAQKYVQQLELKDRFMTETW